MAGKGIIGHLSAYWEQPADQPPKWDVWKMRLDNFIHLSNISRPADAQLRDVDKNSILFGYLGSEGVTRFITDPRAMEKDTLSYDEYSRAAKGCFDKPVLPALAYFEFRVTKQHPGESVQDYISRLRVLQTHCEKYPLSKDNDLALVLSTNCYSKEGQKKLFNEPEVNLDKYIAVLQAEESAIESSSKIRGESVSMSTAAVKSQKFQGKFKSQQKFQPRQNGSNSKPMSSKCFGCGNTNPIHIANRKEQCPAWNVVCRCCNKSGHFEKQCWKKLQSQPGRSVVTKRITVASVLAPSSVFKCSIPISDSSGVYHEIEAVVDSGSDVTLIPMKQFLDHFLCYAPAAPDVQMHNYDKSPISEDDCYGYFEAPAKFDGRTTTVKVYIMSDGYQATFGSDVIRSMGLILNGHNGLVHGFKKFVSPAPIVSTIQTNKTFTPESILQEYPDLGKSSMGKFPNFSHKIVLDSEAQPSARKPKTIPIAYRSKVEQEIKSMVDQGIWEKVIGPREWAHQMVVVPKSNGDIRITTNLRPLNKCVTPQRFPLPKIKDLYLQLKGATVFTKLDMTKGYFHVELDPESRPLTTTITPFGLYQYRRLPMGLTDSASVFQLAVSQVVADCPGCVSYIDDILVFGKDANDHSNNLHQVLKRLHENDLRLNLSKCLFEVSEVSFLGHIVGRDGIRPNPKNIEAISNATVPTTKKQVQSFLGMVNYYREFLPNYPSIAEPLQELTRSVEESQFKWTPSCSEAFESLKKLIAQGLKLAIFDPDCQTILTTDASDIGIGAVLSQIQSEKEVPISFASRTLQSRERDFATNEKEALACVWACEHFEDFLLGRSFELYTDHSALQSILTQRGVGRKNSKFERWRQRLEHFSFNVHHKKGIQNKVADALSRLAQESTRVNSNEEKVSSCTIASVVADGLSWDIVAKAASVDEIQVQILKYLSQGWPKSKKIPDCMHPYFICKDSISLNDGLLFRDDAIIVPDSLRRKLLQLSHTGHPGIVRAKKKLRETYWWPGMSSEIEQFVRSCSGCQDSRKSEQKQKIPKIQIPSPTKAWEKVAVDVTGPFWVAPHTQRFVVVLIDYYSKFPEVLITGVHDAKAVTHWLGENFDRYGNPSMLISDNGPEFISSHFQQFLQSRDIVHHQTPVYHPQENGLVEVFNRGLKHHVQASQRNNQPFNRSITEYLARFRAERPGPHSKSPGEMMFNRRPRLPFEINRQNRKGRRYSYPSKPVDHSQNQMPIIKRSLYKRGELVRVKRPHVLKGRSPYSDPLKVVRVLGYYTYILSDGQKWNAAQMRPFRSPTHPVQIEDFQIHPDHNQHEVIPPPRRVSSRSTKGMAPRRYQSA